MSLHPYFEVVEPFLRACKEADEEGLLMETLAEFFSNLGVTKEAAAEAMYHAFAEWVNK